MTTASLLFVIAASSLVIGGSAMAQNAGGIPNGLSGPGGTMTFTPSPTMPSVGAGADVYGAPTVSRRGTVSTHAPRRIRRSAPKP